jgi:hypothetical protein
LIIFVEEGFHILEGPTTSLGVQEPCEPLACVVATHAEADLQIMIADTKFVLMKMKCVFEPMVFIPIGQTCEEMTEPIEELEAAMLRPRARKLVGKIYVGE